MAVRSRKVSRHRPKPKPSDDWQTERFAGLLNAPLYDILETLAALGGYENDRAFVPGQGGTIWKTGSILPPEQTFKTIWCKFGAPVSFNTVEVSLIIKPTLEFPPTPGKPVTIFRLIRKGWRFPHLLWLRAAYPPKNEIILSSDFGITQRGKAHRKTGIYRLEPGQEVQVVATLRMRERGSTAGAWVYDLTTGEELASVGMRVSTKSNYLRTDYLRVQVGETGNSKYASAPEGWSFSDLAVEFWK